MKSNLDKNNNLYPPLILPIETKVREFHGKLFFAYMAALKGFQVITGDQVQLLKYADLFPNGIYIDKSVASTRISRFKALKESGHKIISWDEEGLIFFNEDVYRKLRLSEEAYNMVEQFFCWGDCQKEIIETTFPDQKRKLHTCGNPRFDLLRQDYREVYRTAADKLTAQYGRIILINTNFSFWNHYKSPEELRGMLQSYPLASEPGYIDGWIDYQKVGFETFCDLIPFLSKQYPDHTVIVRPHPSENHDSYRKVSEQLSNVVVNAEGNVHEWIMASEVLLHDNCTTAVEAFILGVPAFAFRKIRKEQYDNFLPRVLSHSVTTEDDLVDGFDSVMSGDENLITLIWSKENKAHLDHYISGLTNTTSVEVMVEQIAQSYGGEKSELNGFGKAVRLLKLYWRNILNLYRDIKNPPDGYTKQKFPGMTKEEVEDTFAMFDSLFKRNSNFSIETITKDIYKITSN